MSDVSDLAMPTISKFGIAQVTMLSAEITSRAFSHLTDKVSLTDVTLT